MTLFSSQYMPSLFLKMTFLLLDKYLESDFCIPASKKPTDGKSDPQIPVVRQLVMRLDMVNSVLLPLCYMEFFTAFCF